MTELPRYIGRHASPEAAGPSAGVPPPEDVAPEADLVRDDAAFGDDVGPAVEPAMPRLEFDPSGSEEPTTIIDPAQRFAPVASSEEPPPTQDSPPEWWRRESGPAPVPASEGPEPSRFGPSGVSGPPGPPGPPDGSDGPAAASDTWTAPAPDLGSGSVPGPDAVPEAEADSDDDADFDDDAEAEDEDEAEAGPGPEADAEAEPDSEPGADDEPLPDSEPVADLEPETEPRAEEADEANRPAGVETEPAPEPIPEPEAAPEMPLRSESEWSPTPAFPVSGASPIRPVSAASDIDSHGLARIALLDAVKEIWPGGTLELTAWLAAHLELLEDPLGFALTPRHHAPAAAGQLVDDYDEDLSPLDIPGNLLTADLGGAAVVVRAQAHEADTEGLGALLGAAAVAQAQTAVWVCPRIEPGLRQALRWVGGDPSANVRLYGLEMYLVQIAGSPTAPLFDAVVSPGTP